MEKLRKNLEQFFLHNRIKLSHDCNSCPIRLDIQMGRDFRK